jgi:Protein of unknown function (DUF1360)
MGTRQRMLEQSVQDAGLLAGHSPDQQRALDGYAILMSAFLALSGGFSIWMRRTGRSLPANVAASDFAMMTVATHKLSRLIAKDRVTSTVRAPFTRFQGNAGPGEVSEAARGRGLRRAVGELLICPYCLGMWVAAAFTAGLIVAPRPTRWLMVTFSALFGADILQIAYKKAEDSL